MHLLCPVRALRTCIRSTAAPGHPGQLFFSLGPTAGKPVAKSMVSRWIVETIKLVYTSRGASVPDGLRAHSTGGMAASWALCRGISIQDVCTAAIWSSPSTFATDCNLDVAAASLAHAVLDVASSPQWLSPSEQVEDLPTYIGTFSVDQCFWPTRHKLVC